MNEIISVLLVEDNVEYRVPPRLRIEAKGTFPNGPSIIATRLPDVDLLNTHFANIAEDHSSGATGIPGDSMGIPHAHAKVWFDWVIQLVGVCRSGFTPRFI